MVESVKDPGPEAVDKILDGLEDYVNPPTDVARAARRLRAHIEGLRDANAELESLNDQLNTRLEQSA